MATEAGLCGMCPPMFLSAASPQMLYPHPHPHPPVYPELTRILGIDSHSGNSQGTDVITLLLTHRGMVSQVQVGLRASFSGA